MTEGGGTGRGRAGQGGTGRGGAGRGGTGRDRGGGVAVGAGSIATDRETIDRAEAEKSMAGFFINSGQRKYGRWRLGSEKASQHDWGECVALAI